jgi:hypothetical protein
MRALFVALLQLVTGVALAEGALRRVPEVSNVLHLVEDVDKSCNKCTALLSSPAGPGSCPVALVRAVRDGKDRSKSSIEAAYFKPGTGAESSGLYSRGFLSLPISTADLADTIHSQPLTENHLRKVAMAPKLTSTATVIVTKGSSIDTSLLVKHSAPDQFVIEQRSEPARFVENLSRLRDRAFFSAVSVYDFSPRSASSIETMKANGKIDEWKHFSRQIKRSFSSVKGKEALMPPTLDSLEARLKDPSGGVVVIYAHSDGNTILLDTRDGIRMFGPDDIRKIGQENNGKLPPVVLLNCLADAALADAFLQAGSPFVAATDQSLRLTEATSFLDRFARAIYAEKADVIDAYFDAQQKTMPFRLRPMADRAGAFPRSMVLALNSR